MSQKERWTLFLAPLGMVAGLFLFKAIDRHQYWLFCREDGLVENLTALFYFGAVLFSLISAAHFYRRSEELATILCLIMAAGFLFNALEEISWGQRIFHVQSPEFFEEVNKKHETNFHNILTRNLLHAAFILVSTYGAFAHFLVPRMMRRLWGGRLTGLSRLAVPPWYLASYFLPVLFIYLYYEVDKTLARHFGPQFLVEYGAGTHSIFIVTDQEPAEAIMGLGFLLFSIVICRCARAGSPVPSGKSPAAIGAANGKIPKL